MYDVTKHCTKIILSYPDSTSRPAVTTNKNSFKLSCPVNVSSGEFFLLLTTTDFQLGKFRFHNSRWQQFWQKTRKKQALC